MRFLFLLSLLATGPSWADTLPFAFTGSFATRYGQTFDPQDNQGAISFEPTIRLPFDGNQRHLETAAVIDRPMDHYKNFQVPRVALLYSQKLTPQDDWKPGMLVGINALNLDRWRMDGHQIRFTSVGEAVLDFAPGWQLSVRAGPFIQWNAYSQTASGSSFPWIGLQERVRLVWEYKDFAVDLRILVAQSHAAGWNNDYSTLEAVTYRILPGVKIGISHALESSVVDETTGRFRSLQLFDSRVSRISALLELEI